MVYYGIKAEFQFDKISFAFKYIRRTSSIKNIPDTYKSVGLLQYKIGDGLFLTGAFGRNFSSANNLILPLVLTGVYQMEEKRLIRKNKKAIKNKN